MEDDVITPRNSYGKESFLINKSPKALLIKIALFEVSERSFTPGKTSKKKRNPKVGDLNKDEKNFPAEVDRESGHYPDKHKRKHQNNKEDKSIKVTLKEDPTIEKFNFRGPFLASFQGVPPPQNVVFNTYSSSNGRKLMIAGEKPQVTFESNEHEADQSSEYLIAIYNKPTNTVIFRPAP
ncbi:14703_t:CDS:2, partial [Acaulospora morrowiae]